MHADEHHLEAADEVAERQQLEIAVTECLARRFADGLVMAGGRRDHLRFPQRQRQRQRMSSEECQDEQRVLPAHGGNQRLFHRNHQELPKDPAAAAMPMAQTRFSALATRPITP
jgi:hypothetical protein